MSYCAYCKDKPEDNVHRRYHDKYYGFPIEDDNELFGRLILEINQAGLSWETILKKEEGFRQAYDQFDIHKIANYTEEDRARLLSNPAIIRNKLKVNAAIHNANKIIELSQQFGTFKRWLDTHHPMNKAEWTKLFKGTFKFVGGEIVNEFLMSTGYLQGAHIETCEIQKEILKLSPKWLEV